MLDVVRIILTVFTAIGLAGFILTLAVGIPAVFWSSYHDHVSRRDPPRAMSLNSSVFKIGVIFFVVLDIGACGSILVGQGPLS